MLISAYTYRIVYSQFISISLERVDILMSIFLTNLYTHAKKKHLKNIYMIPWNDFDPLRDYFVHNKDKI